YEPQTRHRSDKKKFKVRKSFPIRTERIWLNLSFLGHQPARVRQSTNGTKKEVVECRRDISRNEFLNRALTWKTIYNACPTA
ncbi:hypothetical protein K0M31_019909, partial [Melipona bicolor]